MTFSPWMRKSSPGNESVDVVIIGAGYVGLSTAYWLTESNPSLKLLILDKGQVGAGASGRNAGFLTKGSSVFYRTLCERWGQERALQIFQYGEESLRLAYEHLLSEGSDVSFEATSSMTLMRTEDQLQKCQEFPEVESLFGFRFRALSGNFIGGHESVNEFKVDPVSLLNKLRKILGVRGVKFQENSCAFELRPGEVMTEDNRIKARHVVLAMNGYLPQFSRSFEGIIRPKRAQMLAVSLSQEFSNPWLNYDPPERVYWRLLDSRTLIIGGKRMLDEKEENSDHDKITSVIQQGLEDYLRNILQLKFTVERRWSGIMGFTEHELPLLQRARCPEDVWIIGGFSGHGMGFGFKAGQEMAELMTSKKESIFTNFKKVELDI